MGTRDAIYDEIALGNLSFLNAAVPNGEEFLGPQNQDMEDNYNVHKTLNFKYEQVHSLYEFSENLEQWSKGVQAYVRANPTKFFKHTNQDGNNLG